jgi:hypothetical protein
VRTTCYVKDHLFTQYREMFPNDNLSRGLENYIRDRIAGDDEPHRVCAVCRGETGLVVLCDGCGEKIRRPVKVEAPLAG